MDRPIWYILDENGDPQPVSDVSEVGTAFEDIQKRIVARTEVNGWTVSTVFLVMDHNLEAHDIVFLHGRCHLGGRLEISFRVGSDVLRIACVECGKVVAMVKVAE